MAPAAASTLTEFFIHSGRRPAEYDAIYTGDLGTVGTQLLHRLMEKEGFVLNNHIDCGMVIYNMERQNVPAGASGCGCSGSVLAADILPRMADKKLKKILFMATGALLSTTTTMQKESIPSVAHLVEIVAEKENV
jgi:stage V sporulation protein AD